MELIRSIDILTAEGYKLCLILIGSSEFAVNVHYKDEYQIRDMISKCKAKVICTGFVSNFEVPKWLQISDVQVLPAKCNEAASVSNIEAQAMGLPVISTRRGGIQEYLCKEGTLLVDTNPETPYHVIDSVLVNNLTKSIRYLIDNPIECVNRGKLCREYAKEYTSTKYFNDFYNIIDDIKNRRTKKI
jgi:spore coat protein SA